MTSLRRDTGALNDESTQNDASITQQVEQVESELAQLEAELAEFQQIDANTKYACRIITKKRLTTAEDTDMIAPSNL